MTASAEETGSALVDSACSRVRERVDEEHAPQVEAFVREYYRWVPAEDLLDRDALDVYGAALAHWNFLVRREPGEAKVRVYNPHFEHHGWQSPHTVVEVAADDMSFLVDSVSMAVRRQAHAIHLVIHPVVKVRRDEDGALVELVAPGAANEDDDDVLTESVLHLEVDRLSDRAELDGLRDRVASALSAVRATVEDWPEMRQRVREIVEDLRPATLPVDPDEVEEAVALLSWADDGYFTFLGYREYELVQADGEDRLRGVAGSGLGILRQDGGASTSQAFERLPPRVRALAREKRLLTLTKANSVAPVHRPSYMDYIGVKCFDEDGEVVGERRFLGLYSTAAYKAPARDVPVVRRKVAAVLRRAGFPPRSHSERALTDILENYPRDELFQVTEDELYDVAIGILGLGERQRVRLFVRRDEYERFLSCLVFVPRDRFNTRNRERIQEILREALEAERVDFELRLSESVLARIHYTVRTRGGGLPDYDTREIEGRIVEATREWTDGLQEALVEELGEERGSRLFRRYGHAFTTAYQADTLPRTAVADITRLEELASTEGLGMRLHRPLEAPAGVLRGKLFRAGEPVSLSDVLPMFENMGLEVADERPYAVRPRDGATAWIYDFGLARAGGGELDVDAVGERFEEAFARVWHGDVENDGFNALVLGADLTWRDVTVMRALARYLRQAGTTFSDRYMEQTLARHPTVARDLVELFHARFDPEHGGDEEAAERIAARIEEAIDAVESLDEDRMLRGFLAVLRATLRTNHFGTDASGDRRPWLSIKLDPSRIPIVPAPRPRFEIFVYSPRTEGVHLRGGSVARGGLRWSDRREDFRTEVLGLMKAQMVKNALIVPVGAKGGFVVKRPPQTGDRKALHEEVVACYSTFIRGLLDLTDNIVDGRIVPPPQVVRYDGDDPYLVVAADKGTATFSDLANTIAAEYGFWLGDAFASGGSAGYDHKRMGITARGAWESVKRHFRELGTDIQSTDFTVVGIGDMSGDVFGNGMLLSRHIRLVAAFDHRHVFVDPVPDPERSYEERRRLFELGLEGPTSWDDYDRSLISEGGGVWPRTAKSIPLSPQAQEALGVDVDRATPSEVIRALLQAPVDLLWNGGIGTYVKAGVETHADVGDKANDAIRVDGAQLRAKVAGEGGNLGFTQRGRIEYALAGGRLNTDAIDNAGGVNCSDHEVNIKILLDSVVTDGELTGKRRDELLASMTDAVADLVLGANHRQTEALSLARTQAHAMVDVHDRMMRSLEHAGRLDRTLEALPVGEAIERRRSAGGGLTQPELAVLLAYSKITLYAALLDSDLPEDPYLARDLARYFPDPLPERFGAAMERHRLRREIIATHVTNSMVDRAGITFAFRLAEDTGAPAADIARAYAIAREVFDVRALWAEVEALDAEIAADTQIAMLLDARRLLERATRWLLRNRPRPLDIAATVDRFADGARELAAALPDILAEDDCAGWRARVDELVSAQVPDDLAARAAGLSALFPALDVVEVSRSCQRTVAEVAAVHFKLGARFHLHWLRDRIAELPRQDRWQAMARAALRDDLFRLHAELTAAALRDGPGGGDADASLDAWLGAISDAGSRTLSVLEDIRASGIHNLTTLPVGLREVRNLIQSAAQATEEDGR